MQKLSDHQRRWICRTTFVLFCAAPTLLVLVWMLIPNGPRKWQKKLSQQLGMSVSVKAIKTPRPSTTMIHGTAIKIDESKKWSIDQITLQKKLSSHCYHIDAQPIAASDLMAILRRIIQRQITVVTHDRAVNNLRFDQLIVTARLNEKQKLKIPLRDVTISLHAHQSSWQANCEFKIGSQETKQVQCSLNLDMAGEHLVSISLNTNQSHIPVALFHAWIPNTKYLGPRATFCGSLEIKQTRSPTPQWSASVTGQFDQIDLHNLVNRTVSLVCSGTAKATEFDCQVKNSKIVSLRSTLHCNEGVFDPAIIRAFGQWTNVQIPREIPSAQPFKDLNFRFEIENSRINLWSANPSQQQQNVIAYNSLGQPMIAKTGDSQSETVAFVLRSLLPKVYREQIPMNDQAIEALTLFAQ